MAGLPVQTASPPGAGKQQRSLGHVLAAMIARPAEYMIEIFGGSLGIAQMKLYNLVRLQSGRHLDRTTRLVRGDDIANQEISLIVAGVIGLHRDADKQRLPQQCSITLIRLLIQCVYDFKRRVPVKRENDAVAMGRDEQR